MAGMLREKRGAPAPPKPLALLPEGGDDDDSGSSCACSSARLRAQTMSAGMLSGRIQRRRTSSEWA